MLSGSYTEPAEEQDDEGGLQNVPTRIASRQTKASRSQEQVKSKCFSSMASKPIIIRWLRTGSQLKIMYTIAIYLVFNLGTFIKVYMLKLRHNKMIQKKGECFKAYLHFLG